MITRQELQRITNEKKLPDLAFMEKDYALTWVLKAVFTNPFLSKVLLFKGGTCLSKIFAQNYRLSEDLDFTLRKNKMITADKIISELTKEFKEIKENGGPELKTKNTKVLENEGFIRIKIQYKAVLEQTGTLKFEVSKNEKVIYAAYRTTLRETRYSDIEAFEVNCYAIQEIAVEKLRALFQRGKSRDYYDLWKIMTDKELKYKLIIEASDLRGLLVEKCESNKIDYRPELIFAEEQLQSAKENWETALKRMVSNLPEFEQVIGELKERFFEENELSLFTKDLLADNNLDRLDDIYRGNKTEPLILRAVLLLLDKTRSKRKVEIRTALSRLIEFCENKEYFPVLEKRFVMEIEKLKQDKDHEIRNDAGSLVTALERRGKLI